MKFEKHCEHSIKVFGKPYEEVHKWLDELFTTYVSRHRKFRHHDQGIKECEKLFGVEANEVAKLHIIDDLSEEGWNVKMKFPENQIEYERMGLW